LWLKECLSPPGKHEHSVVSFFVWKFGLTVDVPPKAHGFLIANMGNYGQLEEK
jgi:hypothetical protein